MFNLIVSSGLDGNRRGSMLINRVFEYTNDDVENRFKANGVIDLPAVLSLPTLFMDEGVDDQVVVFGHITRVETRGREYQFHYALDPDMPRMTNADISALAAELHVDDFEFRRKHWAIKDVDLYEVLYRRNVGQRPAPTVFQLSDNPTNPGLVSLMMPFSAEFDGIYQSIKTATDGAGYECRRASDFWLNDHIMQDIIELICTSQVVICDLSGKNPNVFYEAGIAHTLGKQVILVAQSMDDVPFDLRPLRCITYHPNEQGLGDLAEAVVGRLRAIM